MMISLPPHTQPSLLEHVGVGRWATVVLGPLCPADIGSQARFNSPFKLLFTPGDFLPRPCFQSSPNQVFMGSGGRIVTELVSQFVEFVRHVRIDLNTGCE